MCVGSYSECSETGPLGCDLHRGPPWAGQRTAGRVPGGPQEGSQQQVTFRRGLACVKAGVPVPFQVLQGSLDKLSPAGEGEGGSRCWWALLPLRAGVLHFSVLGAPGVPGLAATPLPPLPCLREVTFGPPWRGTSHARWGPTCSKYLASSEAWPVCGLV